MNGRRPIGFAGAQRGARKGWLIRRIGEVLRLEADAVVLNPDLPVAYRDLLGQQPLSVRRLIVRGIPPDLGRTKNGWTFREISVFLIHRVVVR